MYDKINYAKKYRKSKICVIPGVAKGFPGTRKNICTNSEMSICTTHGVIGTTKVYKICGILDILVPRTSTTRS